MVCLSVTFMHPAKAIGWNEMPFVSHTSVVPGRKDLGVGTPSLQQCHDAVCRQITLALVIKWLSLSPTNLF